MLHCVIMAGGRGTRFWPLSRHQRPKQFLPLLGETSLIQAASERCRPLVSDDRAWVITATDLADLTAQQLPGLPSGHILTEPVGRNTAPAIALAAVALLAEDPDATMLVLPSDHVIGPVTAFTSDVELAVDLVHEDPSRLVLFGAPPTWPATGFGYIQPGPHLRDSRAFAIGQFREKPSRDVAEQLIHAGCLWNCGIFVWKARTILESLKNHAPDVAAGIDRIRQAWSTPLRHAALADEFPGLPSISIDHAVLEHAPNVCVVRAGFDWDDLGGWEAIARRHSPAPRTSSVSLSGKTVALNTTGSILRSTDDHLVAAVDVDHLLIIHTPDATLVAPRNDEAALRRLVDELRQQGLDQFL